ncbi:MAG: S-formylglutathione hydrolase [Polyangiaceae bacterium]
MEISKEHRSFGGRQLVLRHQSRSTGTAMECSLYLPPAAQKGPVPAVVYLSGLSCTWENVTTKGAFARHAAELGLAVICPDTSPRGDSVPDDDAYDLGQGAGMYVDATEEPWSKHYKMYSYVTEELLGCFGDFPVETDRVAITGHSMGGHGALIIGLRDPDTFVSVSALAPIGGPTEVPWGKKTFSEYLGEDPDGWADYDACRLLAADKVHPRSIRVDQGASDPFLTEQLQPSRLEAAAKAAGQELELAVHEGYDHSYYFVASFLGEHLAFHAERLR